MYVVEFARLNLGMYVQWGSRTWSVLLSLPSIFPFRYLEGAVSLALNFGLVAMNLNTNLSMLYQEGLVS